MAAASEKRQTSPDRSRASRHCGAEAEAQQHGNMIYMNEDSVSADNLGKQKTLQTRGEPIPEKCDSGS